MRAFVFTFLVQVALLFSIPEISNAQQSITATNFPIAQNFDALPVVGPAFPSGGIFSEGWLFLESGTNANSSFQAGSGSSNTGDTYSFGVQGTHVLTERSFGMLQSGTLTSVIGYKFTNNTGQAIAAVTISYTGELWRLNNAGDKLVFSYQLGDQVLNALTGWITVPELEFATPQTGSSAAIDGNDPINRTVLPPFTIHGLYIPNGVTVTLRWTDASGVSSAAMAIDDFSLTLVPASPGFFRSAASGTWNSLASWVSSTDEHTWQPATTVPTEQSAGITIATGHTITVDADLTVSKIIVQAGATLLYTKGILTLTEAPGDDLFLEGENSVFEIAAALNPLLMPGASVRIASGAFVRLSGNNNLLPYHTPSYSYADGAVFEYSNGSVPSISGTFFLLQDVDAVPVFRYNSGYTGPAGGPGSTIINGKVDVAAGKLFNLSAVAGSLVMRNGITGSGDVLSTSTILLNGTTAALSGTGILNSNTKIGAGCTATLCSDKTFTKGNQLTVDGIFDLGGFSLQSVNGPAVLTVGTTGTIRTANAAGLVNSTGSLRSNNFSVTFNAGSQIEYNASGEQFITVLGLPSYQHLRIAGTGLKTVQGGGNLVVQGSLTVSNGVGLALTGRPTENLYLNNNAALQVLNGGTFDNGGESSITTSAGTPLVSIWGTFITRDQQGFTGSGSAIPTVTPTLNPGSTIEYGREGDQAIQANLTYQNLTLSGSGIKTPSNALSLTGSLTLSGAVILDGSTHTIGGLGNNLIMTGTSRFINGVTGTAPAMDGTYSLAPSTTLEFTNTNVTGQTIRQGSSPFIAYANVEITGSNVALPLSGIQLQAGATLSVGPTGVLKVSSANGLLAPTNAGVLSSNNPQIVLQPGSTIDYNGAGQVLTTGYVYSNLVLSGTGTKMANAPFQVWQKLTMSGSALLAGSSPVFGFNATLAYSDATPGRRYISGLEWPVANGPTNLFVSLTGGGAAAVSLVHDQSVTGWVNLAAGMLDLNGQTLALAGGLTGSGALKGSPVSSLEIRGGNATLNFNQLADGASNALRTLRINSGSATLGSRLQLYDLLDIAGGSLNLAGQDLLLKSTEAATARVAERKGLLSGETNVTVERYIPDLGIRKWRLVTSPVKGVSINGSWQEGRTWNSGSAAEAAVGYGTLITGGSSFGSAGAAAASGFDYWPLPAGATASVRYYSGSGVVGNNDAAEWLELKSTITPNAFDNHQAYRVYVRGDRSFSTGSTAGATVLRAKGTLKEELQHSIALLQQSHTLIGNPYASPLDFKKFYAANSDKIEPYFWIWQANLAGLYGLGGYALLYPDANNPDNYLEVPGTGTATAANRLIHSGQGFFVMPRTEAPAVSFPATLTLAQAHKAVSLPGVQVFRQAGRTPAQRGLGAGAARLFVNLYIAAPSGEGTLMDGALAQYSAAFAAGGDNIAKAFNSGENLSLYKGGRSLIVGSAVPPQEGDTLWLRLQNTTTAPAYQLRINSDGFEGSGLSAVLVDAYLHKETPISLLGTAAPYAFKITADAGAKDPQRFFVVFHRAPVLANVTLVAEEQRGGVRIKWAVDEERGVQAYTLERSADGTSFEQQAAVAARSGSGAQNYERVDGNPLPLNYYRVRVSGTNGTVWYSDTARIELPNMKGGVVLYPNPVSGPVLSVQLVYKPAGRYTLTLYNSTGQQVRQQKLQHTGGTMSYTLTLGSAIASGHYTLEVRNPSGAKENIPLQVAR